MLVATVAVAAFVLILLVLTGSTLTAPQPPPRVKVVLAASSTVPGVPPVLPWPPTGQAAVAIPALGYAAQSGPEHPVPVASMTKVMTAYVVLTDHPLATGQNGPSITVTPTDAADYTTDLDTTQASVALQAGEVFTEREALEGLLVHSANDLAFTLAEWDAGSVPAFVAKMNATAARLGMVDTHYADASGYTPESVSTPADLLRVTAAAMALPAFAQAVSMPSTILPQPSGTVSSYTPLLAAGTGGVPGVVGVKSGYTTAAGGGDILAYQTSAAGRPLTVLAAVTTQRGPTVLDAAGNIDLALARAAASAVVGTTPSHPGAPVATVTCHGHRVPAVTAASATLLAEPGQAVRQTMVVTHRPHDPEPAGSLLGTALYTLGEQQVAVPVRVARRLPS